MTCRCGHQFCYVCGQRWRTCSCTMDQLYALKGAAQERREHRRFTEQTEAAELRQILAQIELFEQEEARRAELERLENTMSIQGRIDNNGCAPGVREAWKVFYETIRARREILAQMQMLDSTPMTCNHVSSVRENDDYLHALTSYDNS